MTSSERNGGLELFLELGWFFCGGGVGYFLGVGSIEGVTFMEFYYEGFY